MTQEKFPLVRQLGLKVDSMDDIHAPDLEKLLEAAPVVKGSKCDFGTLWRQSDNKNIDYVFPEFVGRVVAIQPIRKESEERALLREMVEDWKKYGPKDLEDEGEPLRNRARLHARAEKLLERGE